MEILLVVVAAVLAGVVVFLKRVAPKTKTSLDDKMLVVVEKASGAVDAVVVKTDAPATVVVKP